MYERTQCYRIHILLDNERVRERERENKNETLIERVRGGKLIEGVEDIVSEGDRGPIQVKLVHLNFIY